MLFHKSNTLIKNKYKGNKFVQTFIISMIMFMILFSTLKPVEAAPSNLSEDTFEEAYTLNRQIMNKQSNVIPTTNSVAMPVEQWIKGIAVTSNTMLLSKYSFIPRWIPGTTSIELFGDVQWDDNAYEYGDSTWAYGFIPSIDKREREKVGVYYRNVGTYRGAEIDLKITVMDWESVGPENGYIAYLAGDDENKGEFGHNMNGYWYVDQKWEFIDANTQKPIRVNGYMNIVDIDREQAVVFDKATLSSIDNLYVSSNPKTVVQFKPLASGEAAFVDYDDVSVGPEDPEGQFIFTFSNTSQIRFKWSREHGKMRHPPGAVDNRRVWYGDYFSFTGKKFIDSHMTPATLLIEERNTEKSANLKISNRRPEDITLSLEQFVQDESPRFYYNSYLMTMMVDSRLEIKAPLKVMGDDGVDYTNMFNIFVNNNRVEARAKPIAVQSPSFYNKYYKLVVPVEVKDLDNAFLNENSVLYKFYGFANKNDLNGSATVADLYLSDTQSPQLNLSTNTTEPTNQDVVISVSAVDEPSGVKGVRISDGNWIHSSQMTYTASENGTYTFFAEDNAGHTTSQSIEINNIDKTPPDGIITSSTTAWTNQNVVLTLKATDTGGSGVRRVRQVGGSWVNGSTTTRTVSTNGTYKFEIEDNAGNIKDVSYNVTNIDKTIPNGSISGNPTTWTRDNTTLNFTGTDAGGSGVRRVKGPNGVWVNGATISQSVSSNGTYTFSVQDNAGNIKNIQITVTKIDKTAPTGTISGNPTSWTNQNVTLSFNATDTGGSGVKRVQLPSGTWVNGSIGSQSVSSNGTYVFRVEDNAGNFRDVSVVVNRIDKTLPNGTITGNPSTWTNQDITLGFTGTDTGGSGIKRIRRPSGTWVNGHIATEVIKSNGTYTFRVEDNAGNYKDVSMTVDRIDKVSPSENIIKIKVK